MAACTPYPCHGLCIIGAVDCGLLNNAFLVGIMLGMVTRSIRNVTFSRVFDSCWDSLVGGFRWVFWLEWMLIVFYRRPKFIFLEWILWNDVLKNTKNFYLHVIRKGPVILGMVH